MSKIAIMDACFSENMQASSFRGVSAQYLGWMLAKRNIKESPISDADIILVSCQSVESLPVIKALRNKYPNKKIYIGGSVGTEPYTIGKYCDAVCVGDGTKFIDLIVKDMIDDAMSLPNIWIDGDSRDVFVDEQFPWEMPPLMGEDGAYRIVCGRGCKKKCKFCQTGWAHEYQEAPDAKLLIERAKHIMASGDKIAYISNDIAQHSFYRYLPVTNHGSYSIDYLSKYGLPKSRQIRLGIEGVSQNIRSFVAKPISYSDLLYCTKWLNDNHKSVRWFMIAGLPTETNEDWDELREIITQWKEKVSTGVLALSFTAYKPEPATPLAEYPITDEYWANINKFRNWFFDGKGWSNRIKIMFPARPENRMKVAMNQMGLSETQLREGGHKSPNLRIKYRQKYMKK